MSKQDSTERRAEARRRMLAGETHAAIAEALGVSVATVRRDLKQATAESLDSAEAKSAEKKAERREARAADRAATSGSQPKANGSSGSVDDVMAMFKDRSDEDRAAVREVLDGLKAAEFALPPSRAYARARTADGTVIAVVESTGRIWFPEGSPEAGRETFKLARRSQAVA